jgi:hypothetical protein
MRKTMEVEMKWYDFDDADMSDDDQNEDGGSRRSAKRQVDEPRRSPIRRKDKLRPEEGFKSKAKRNHKKILNKIKYDWQGE